MRRAAAAFALAALAAACGPGGIHSTADDRALIMAASKGDVAEVQRLIAAGADVNYHGTRYGRSRTALSEAVHGRHIEIIDILEKADAQEW
jgi:hypothetical protein